VVTPSLPQSSAPSDATIRYVADPGRGVYGAYAQGLREARGEYIWARAQQPTSTVATPSGFYISADYQFARRWFFGGRVDHSDRPFNAHLTDKGASAVLTYWPSEFSQVRGQYRFTRYAGNLDAHELFVQLIFSLGAHGAHPF